MEKIKITAESIPEIKVVTLTCKDGTYVQVKEHIPYDSKEALALELAMYTSVTDDAAEIMYDSYKKPLIECALVAKYYTNIDVSQMNEEKDWKILFDWLTMNGIYAKLFNAIEDDYKLVRELYMFMRCATYRSYEGSHALSMRIKKSFASILTDEDIAETIAKSEAVNNQMVDLLGAVTEKKENASTKNDKLSLDGGAVINLAKKRSKKN